VNPLLRRSVAHVFVESLDAPAMSASDQHHLVRVLRVGPTDPVTVGDGAGRWAPAVLGPAGLQLAGEVVVDAQPVPRCVACAIPKGDRPEWIVQKLTELGIDRIVLFEATHSVVRWDRAKVQRNLERLRRVAVEASMQSRRVWLPTVEVLSWTEVLALPGVALAEPGAERAVDPAVHTLVVGPEGGFSAAELASGVPTVSLGEQVLRVETAAVVAGVLLDLGRSGRTHHGA
jgi:16S rRNA (uracil1498-N3)-methyltransferase